MKAYLVVSCFFFSVLFSPLRGQTIDSIAKYPKLTNEGLYGGVCLDLAVSKKTNRIFGAFYTPYSLFATDDNGSTWHTLLPIDSLYYIDNGIEASWGGQALQVATNTKGWTAARTLHDVSKATFLLFSKENGDSASWHLVSSSGLLSFLGYGDKRMVSMCLTDYNLYSTWNTLIIPSDSSSKIDTAHIIDLTSYITYIDSTYLIKSIAVTNNVAGLPMYGILSKADKGSLGLFKFNGSGADTLVLPGDLKQLSSVFVQPADSSGNTIIISGFHKTTFVARVYISTDGGLNWTATTNAGTSSYLTDVEYNADWATSLPISNGLILVMGGEAISKDLGATWEKVPNVYAALTIRASDYDTIFGIYDKLEMSTNGATGTFIEQANTGLEALMINDFDVWDVNISKKPYYAATQYGLVYTRKLADTSVAYSEKWKAPYGAILADSINFTAVAINPLDSSNVIAAFDKGFYVSHTGLNGFNVVTPGFGDSLQIKDVLVYGSIALAVSGGDSTYHKTKGDIWRSTDGGDSWTKINLPGFYNGRTLAIGISSVDTLILAGTGFNNADSAFIWSSTNWGSTWQIYANAPASSGDTAIKSLPINDIDFVPYTTDSFYVAAGYDEQYAFAGYFDSAKTLQTYNLLSSGNCTAISINSQTPDTMWLAKSNRLYLFERYKNKLKLYYEGPYGEGMPHLQAGSILAGTTTGFYSIDMEPFDDNAITFIPVLSSNTVTIHVYPNPTKNDAKLQLYFKEKSYVFIDLVDTKGNMVKSIYAGNVSTGLFEQEFSLQSLIPGRYILQLHKNGRILTSTTLVVE